MALIRVRATRVAVMLAAALAVGCATDTGGAGGVLPAKKKMRKKSKVAVQMPVALDAWARVGNDVWRPAQNQAQAGPGDDTGYLVSQRERGDFRFSVDYFVTGNTNSGVFVRCRNPLKITSSTCYEINIWDQHPQQEWRTGALVTRQEAMARVEGLDRWVRLEIEARGSTIKAWFDGVQTVEYSGAAVARGRLALQYGGTGEVTFRNAKVEPLGP